MHTFRPRPWEQYKSCKEYLFACVERQPHVLDICIHVSWLVWTVTAVVTDALITGDL